MKSWPNILNLFLVVIIILLFTGVIDTQGPVKPSEKILGFIKERQAEAAIVIDKDGHFSAINKNASTLTECSVGPKGKHSQCKGLAKDSTVLTSSMVNIMTVRASGCILLIDGNGKASEFCWQ